MGRDTEVEAGGGKFVISGCSMAVLGLGYRLGVSMNGIDVDYKL